LLQTRLGVRLGEFSLDKPLLLWINDGLMAVFFFLVGLEIKRELLVGELSTREQAALPVIGAVGGMVLPALIYMLVNITNPAALNGWAIPTATDIAFVMGLLALLGRHAPPALKVFMLAMAIIVDLAAVIIIALLHASELSFLSFGLAAAGIGLLIALNALSVTRVAPYVLTGIFIWACVLQSGVHAALVGVVVALAVPLYVEGEEGSPLQRLEHNIEPWVLFGVMPLFAFANAGVSLAGMSFATLLDPIPLGIALGLIMGKAVGTFGAAWAAIHWGYATKPAGVSGEQMLGASILGGIGFTMSLFIGMLAFPDPDYATSVRVGVLTGSLVSAVMGYLVLRFAPGESKEQRV
jgi:NhaA family Na+:H+ antiporter